MSDPRESSDATEPEQDDGAGQQADDFEYDEVHDGGTEPTEPGQGPVLEPPD